MGVITLVCVLVGQFALSTIGLVFGFAFGVVLNGAMYFGAGALILKQMGTTLPIDGELDEVTSFVKDIATKATITTPDIRIAADAQPNIFTVGYDASHATIVITRGLVELMSNEELKNIIAPQIGTIQRGDIGAPSYIALLMGILTGFGRVPRKQMKQENTLLLNPGNNFSSLIRLITMPMAVAFLRWTVEPQKKYLQDFLGASLTREPKVLANAYRKAEITIEQNVPLLHNYIGYIHLYALCPTTESEGNDLYQSHPKMIDRIMKLEGMTV